jgi:diadenylate cyclase
VQVEQLAQMSFHRRLSPEVASALRLVAPGTILRAGLERILRAQLGALVVLTPEGIEPIRSGGFHIDTELTEPKLSELAKMDGALVLSADGTRILWANVQLMPSPSIPAFETGTRHRTAERTARQLTAPVIAVSEDMRTISLYVRDEKYMLQSTPALLQRANQALATLERYRARLDHLYKALTQLELQDLVTLDEVGDTLARFEVVRRVAEEIDSYVLELGEDGRLIRLQLDEMMAGVEGEAKLLVRDYCRPVQRRSPERCMKVLSQVGDEELWSPDVVARVLGWPSADEVENLPPRGHRLLAKIPRLPPSVIDGLVKRFDTLEAIRKAALEELMEVDGVGESRARSIIVGLERLADVGVM